MYNLCWYKSCLYCHVCACHMLRELSTVLLPVWCPLSPDSVNTVIHSTTTSLMSTLTWKCQYSYPQYYYQFDVHSHLTVSPVHSHLSTLTCPLSPDSVNTVIHSTITSLMSTLTWQCQYSYPQYYYQFDVHSHLKVSIQLSTVLLPVWCPLSPDSVTCPLSPVHSHLSTLTWQCHLTVSLDSVNTCCMSQWRLSDHTYTQ